MAKPERPDGDPPADDPGLSRLPPGRHGLSREFVAANQRDRLTAGVIAAVSEHGYHEATITQIAAAAGVSRRTFYSYFSDKQECFLDAYDQIERHLLDSMRAAAAPQPAAPEPAKPAAPEPEWPRRVRASLAAMLDVFAANPDLARVFLIAPQAAGGELLARCRLALSGLLAVLTEPLPPPPATRPLSEAAGHGLAGGLSALIAAKVRAGEGERLPELAPDLLELILTPYLGRAEAVRIARQAG